MRFGDARYETPATAHTQLVHNYNFPGMQAHHLV
jgi:hypothetical protein